MTTNELRDEIHSALKHGAPHAELVTIVLRHKARGMSQRATYDTLQEIWSELGCDNNDGGEDPACEPLGDLMDCVWGYCSVRDAIWDSSLTGAPD